jgi:hypothetical protein
MRSFGQSQNLFYAGRLSRTMGAAASRSWLKSALFPRHAMKSSHISYDPPSLPDGRSPPYSRCKSIGDNSLDTFGKRTCQAYLMEFVSSI